ncbi:hypothetical protein KFK09_022676 [Dendrobium nobile]|uniref:Uncharacterized protein n=1 Tax=Dendrobium nobile TaxID=94219 RepID=A0A8T3AJT3_DENNO|nr:hypothetical protein KFK09_022676 [Dendrobium nobile]
MGAGGRGLARPCYDLDSRRPIGGKLESLLREWEEAENVVGFGLLLKALESRNQGAPYGNPARRRERRRMYSDLAEFWADIAENFDGILGLIFFFSFVLYTEVNISEAEK